MVNTSDLETNTYTMMPQQISLCFTNYNRSDLLFQAFEQILNDERISEVVISDDNSRPDILEKIYFRFKDISKVKIFKNDTTNDCYFNKKLAIERASNEWVCILDSDNIFGMDYLNRIENIIRGGLNPKTIYQPDFAKPHFNFTHLSGQLLSKRNIGHFMDNRSTDTMLNAMNYFVNRDEYLRIFDPNTNPVTSDSIYQNYRWLDAGNMIYVVPSFSYDHRVDDHNGEERGHYSQNNGRTPRHFHESIINKLKAMK